MARLIDADRLGEVLDRYFTAPHVQLKSMYSEGMRSAIASCISFLNMQPTVEAYTECPVCRVCIGKKHFDPDDYMGEYEEENE